MPFNTLKEWLNIEKEKGVDEPSFAVLSTSDSLGSPHSRIVAIREITNDSLVFFTQRKTAKVKQLTDNPKACLNFVFSLQGRQVILKGEATPISTEENARYWASLPRERQLRFSAYAPTSGQAINDLDPLENKKKALLEQFQDQAVPMSGDYMGFRFIPTSWIFYTVGTDTFSKVLRYIKQNGAWHTQLLSP